MGVGDASVIDKLKAQRDRFIAFAFAGADLLLEIGEDDVITYSAGAGEALYGLSDSDLTNKRLGDFVHAKDRKRFDDAVLKLRNTGRLDHMALTLVTASGSVARLRLAGIRLPQFPKTYHLVLSRIPPMAVAEPDRMGTEIDHKAQFIEMVQQRLNEANRIGQDYTLTLFDLSGSNFDAIEPAAAQSFMSTVLHTLEECSVRGNSAGSLSERTFGLIHDDKVTAASVQQRIAALAGKFTGKSGAAAAIKMRSSTLEMEDSTLSEEDIGKAMTYIINGFTRDSARFTMKTLADGARLAVEETLVRVKNFRKMVKGEDKLAFLFQPVVNLRTGAVLKYEAFCRITHNGNFFLPAQIIPFATDVGLIGEFDLLTIAKALKMLREPTEISPLAIIAVNVSGQSLGNPAFYQSLFRLLEDNRQVLGRLVIEVTDAVSIYNLDEAKRLLARIRKLGARISLDDFGTGGSAFDLLRMLPVDFAKIDASYILDARDPKGKSVLKAITGLCSDLGIITVGECVEDAATMQILREVNVDYAQGYYFAHPAIDGAKRIKYFTDHVKAAGTAEPGLMLVGK
ncbi:MAG: EAL domain-containing protein [Rhodospirillaceae bacterium]|nr:EAL domain-containing protein [Rhodospirillales bacterium]